MRRYSTGKLSTEQHLEQDAVYRAGHKYDYLIIGTGMSALTCGALLAHAGYRVCMLEAHDVPGGYAHTFEMEGYHFCAQVHYIWGCQPGGTVYDFLRKVNLHQKIPFERYSSDGYDHATLPDGSRVKIPYGYDNLVNNIDQAFPGQREKVQQFVDILTQLLKEMHALPNGNIHWWQYVLQSPKFLTLLRYRNYTLQNLFDKCGLSREAQAVLSANSGDFGAPPKELSIIAYAGLMGGYNEGAFYPKHHYSSFVEGIAKSITDHPDCHIFYETKVTELQQKGDRIAYVTTEDGKTFTADNIICNADPKVASQMIGQEKFPKKFIKPLSYDYSPSSFMIYLGIKDIDLRDYGFGKHNTWNLEQWDMNKMWDDARANNYEKPWFFISTPSLFTDDHSTAPEGCQCMEVGTMTMFEHFNSLKENSPSDYRKAKREFENRLFDIIEDRFIPNFRKYIAMKISGTPTTNVDFCYAPEGNAYGSHMSPENIGLGRLKSYTPFKNFFWCNASSGYAGVAGTVNTGVRLYTQLTGDPVETVKEDLAEFQIQQQKESELTHV